MYKLLLAEHSDTVIREVMEALDDRWEVRICGDANRVKEMLSEFDPDALIIDLSLPGKNAITVISECFPNLPSLIIALGSEVNPFIRQHLSRWGVDYVFETASGKGLFRSIMCSLETFNKIAVKRTVEHLRALGVQAGRVGYVYLLLVVPHISEGPTRQLHNEIYRHVSGIVNAEESSIEHAIRTAIISAWRNRINDVWSRYFPVDESGNVSCPNVKDFVSALAQRII